MAPRVGIFAPEDRLAIFRAAKQLRVDPYEFGGFLTLESGPNMSPSIRGGAGNRHLGMIQFGPNEQQMYGVNPSQSRAQQMSAVLNYFQDRGYKPGMGIERLYATVLGGNPNVSLTQKDSFGTSVQSAATRFKKGGDLYESARRTLGDLPAELSPTAPPTPPPAPAVLPSAANATEQKKSLSQMFLQDAIKNFLPDNLPNIFGLFSR